MPAGKMEQFFREVTKADAMPPQDPELWSAHGMELLGPPLQVQARTIEARVVHYTRFEGGLR